MPPRWDGKELQVKQGYLGLALGIWTTCVAFHLAVPFTGSFLITALLVGGVAVPTPGAVGGFHAAFPTETETPGESGC